MNVIDPILRIASEIRNLVGRVQANKERCYRVAQRVKALEELVRPIQQRETVRTCVEVEKALKELCITLESAQELIKKYTLASWVHRILNSNNHGDEFSSVNERLNDAFQILSGALQVEQSSMLHKVFELASREKEDEMDRREDEKELQRYAMLRQFEHVKVNVEKVVAILKRPKVTSVDIRMIKLDELKYEHPKKPFMTTATSEVYRGEYHGFAVAIKRYINPVNTSPKEVRSVFNKEVDTMKRFESPNILRMFGICVHESRPNPEFLIIMEYCEKGSLRQFLDSGCKLSWTRKARICLGAVQGLYRSVCNDFLDLNRGVGLQCSPLNHRPESGCSDPDKEIYQKVYKERYLEPLPNDCPKPLRQLIDACRAYDSFLRPSAGVLADKLRSVVAQMEETIDTRL
uniref:Uncharacterized protein n=1 Tax=Stegastes partitus TaxID=144197 RepID=A0A3B4Z969_9TELE